MTPSKWAMIINIQETASSIRKKFRDLSPHIGSDLLKKNRLRPEKSPFTGALKFNRLAVGSGIRLFSGGVGYAEIRAVHIYVAAFPVRY